MKKKTFKKRRGGFIYSRSEKSNINKGKNKIVSNSKRVTYKYKRFTN